MTNQLAVLLLLYTIIVQFPSINSEKYHTWDKRRTVERLAAETDTKFWYDKAQNSLRQKLNLTQNLNKARNIIFFLGDGMSIATQTAARTYEMELRDIGFGEGNSLSFEQFPYSGLSKTYCVDYKVADSACSSTAYCSGVKGNQGTIGVNGKVERRDCKASNIPENRVDSIAKWFQDAGKATGFVTTTRVTHASPAGLYAHVAERAWESDKDVTDAGEDDKICDDIAEQLIFNSPGSNLNVIMGGGLSWFLPLNEGGKRKDGKHLISEWASQKKNTTANFITTRDELLKIKESPDNLLGLFADGHMNYHLDGIYNQPELMEMTEQAIKVLQKNENGFFLFVEGGRIDSAHHGNRAHLALDETVELSTAVERARFMTDPSETLIVVSADHAHTMTLNGYPPRSASIFSVAGKGDDKLPYSVLSYANGPSYVPSRKGYDSNPDKMNEAYYRFPSGAPLKSESHGGDDVAVFADGPWSHLFSGSYEQNYIPHAMAYAACVGEGETICSNNQRQTV